MKGVFPPFTAGAICSYASSRVISTMKRFLILAVAQINNFETHNVYFDCGVEERGLWIGVMHLAALNCFAGGNIASLELLQSDSRATTYLNPPERKK
jgi:hypothetical protein